MLLLFGIVFAALSVSFVCSILEAGLLSLRLSSLVRRKEAGEKSAGVLLEIRENRLDDAITAILTYNTVAHTIGATLAGAQAAIVFGNNWVGLFSGVLTLLVLILTEIIPKTIGAVHAEKLYRPLAWFLTLLLKPPIAWILVLTRSLTRIFVGGKKTKATRGDVLSMVQIAAREGALSEDESVALTNLLRVREIKIINIMTPRPVVEMAEVETAVSDVLDSEAAQIFSRLLVYEGQKDNVIGYVLVKEVLWHTREREQNKVSLRDLLRPVPSLDEQVAVGDAFKELLRSGEHLAAVHDEFGALSGLVTMEDILETALGVEIVDELDQTSDMRQLALDLRDRRQQRMRQSGATSQSSK